MTRRRAFTLLELLAAMAMMVMIAGALAASLHTAFRARRSAEQAVAASRTVHLAADLVAAELADALPPTGVFAGPFLGAADAVIFHRSGAQRGAAVQGDIKQVQLSFDPGNNGPGVLARRVSANLLPFVEVEPEPETICRNVMAFSLRYFDGLYWLDTWDSTLDQLDALPLAVEMTLELSASGADGALSRTVRLIPLSCASSADVEAALGGVP